MIEIPRSQFVANGVDQSEGYLAGFDIGATRQFIKDQLVVNDLGIHIVGLKGQIEGYQDRIKDLELINASHRIENGELQERINELEELMPTKEESMWLLDRIGIAKYFIVNHSVIAKLQKIIDKRG